MRERRELILILGGARSGKSRYAEQLAGRIAGDGPVLYIATAEAHDAEMQARIARHVAQRPAHWVTLEAPRHVDEAIRAAQATIPAPVILLDCITLLVTNLLLDDATLMDGEMVSPAAEERASKRTITAIDTLLAAYGDGTASLIVVSNEVGMGIVPPYPLGRVYRDILGHVNARLAAAADTVLLLFAGLPIEIKHLAAEWEAEATKRYDQHDS